MILLRQRCFDEPGDGGKKGGDGKKNGRFYTYEELDKIKRSEYNKGVGSAKKAAEEEAKKAAEEAAKDAAKSAKRKAIISKTKKAAPWVIGGLAVAGTTAAGVKAYKNNKAKKAEEEIKNKVRGYGDTKKKA